jgi:hypothetical protein
MNLNKKLMIMVNHLSLKEFSLFTLVFLNRKTIQTSKW